MLDNKYFNCVVLSSSDINKVHLDSTKPSTLNWSQFSNVEILCISDNRFDINDIFSVSSTVEIDFSKLIETPLSLKTYSVALLDSFGNPIYENGFVKECLCSNAFEIKSNEEGSCLSGRKLIVSGNINQTIVYTSNAPTNPLHSINFKHPFTTYITVYPNFIDVANILRDVVVIDPADPTKFLTIKGYVYTKDSNLEVNMLEDFCVNAHVEDTFVKLLDNKNIYKSISIFLSAVPTSNS